MKFYPTLEETLAQRFDDIDECRDISNHGIAGGFSDFIYNFEIDQFYQEFETEIEDKLIDDLGLTYEELVKGASSFQEIRIKCVWIVAEEFCIRKCDLVEAA